MYPQQDLFFMEIETCSTERKGNTLILRCAIFIIKCSGISWDYIPDSSAYKADDFSSGRRVRRLLSFCTIAQVLSLAARMIFPNAFRVPTSEYSGRNYSSGFALHRLPSRKPNFIGGRVVSAPPEELGPPSADWKSIDWKHRGSISSERTSSFISCVARAYLTHVSRHFNRLIPDASNFAIGIKGSVFARINSNSESPKP